MNFENEKNNRAVMVGIYEQGGSDECERSLDELERLLDTAGSEAFARVTQEREAPDTKTCIGKGKIDELAKLCEDNDVNLVVFDTELSPSQIKNIENEIKNADVIDRSMLILDIFAQHATSSEGRIQVELAQLQYTAPRLIGKGTQMSRLGGGIGTRGPGESKLEIDRRRLKTKIAALEEELKRIDRNRMTMRSSRDRSGIVKAAIVGYTNAGKSTLLNRLTNAGILAEDKLFATLDPTTRKFALPEGTEILLTDTVGFIRRLPHHLIKAFKSTLDEAVYADILLVIIDASDEECTEHIEVTKQILTELGAADKPIIYVFNKCDLGMPEHLVPVMNRIADSDDSTVFISAKTGEGVQEFSTKLEETIRLHCGKTIETFKIPNSEMAAVNKFYENSEVKDIEYGDEFVTITALVDSKIKGTFKKYIMSK